MQTISTEAALKHVLALREKYTGAARGEIDRLIEEFREKYGSELTVNEAYAEVKEIEARINRVKPTASPAAEMEKTQKRKFRAPDWLRNFLLACLKFSVYVAGFWAAFHLIFDFSNAQAFGLGLVIAFAIDMGSSRKGPSSVAFCPHLIGIYPHLGSMLIDLGLITDEAFKVLVSDVPPFHSWSDRHIFHYAIRAFVISYEPANQTEVIHLPELGFYSAKLELTVKLSDIEIPGRYSEWSPEFFVHRSTKGHAFGLRVNDQWWKENRSKVAAGVVLEEDHEYNFGQVRLTMAILPYRVTTGFYTGFQLNLQSVIKELVGEHGWKNEPRGGDDLPYYGESYEHKYMMVWTDDLD